MKHILFTILLTLPINAMATPEIFKANSRVLRSFQNAVNEKTIQNANAYDSWYFDTALKVMRLDDRSDEYQDFLEYISYRAARLDACTNKTAPDYDKQCEYLDTIISAYVCGDDWNEDENNGTPACLDFIDEVI